MNYTQHTVSTGRIQHQFKEVKSEFDTEIGGIQLSGQANTITEFINSLELENQWLPYGYFVRYVVRLPESKNMTARLYRL